VLDIVPGQMQDWECEDKTLVCPVFSLFVFLLMHVLSLLPLFPSFGDGVGTGGCGGWDADSQEYILSNVFLRKL